MAVRSTPHKTFRASALILTLVLASGCSSWTRLQAVTPSAYAEAGSSSRIRVELTNGRMITVYSPRMEADTLRGLCATSSASKSAMFISDPPQDSCAFALRDVRRADVRKFDLTRTIVLLSFPAAFFLALYSLGQDD